MLRSLVGSEMCIRDRFFIDENLNNVDNDEGDEENNLAGMRSVSAKIQFNLCLLHYNWLCLFPYTYYTHILHFCISRETRR